jgi:hypothetical protein
MNHRAHFKGDIQVDGDIVKSDNQPVICGYLPDYANQSFPDYQGLDDGAADNAEIDATFTPVAIDKWVEVKVTARLEAGQNSWAAINPETVGIGSRINGLGATQPRQEAQFALLIPPGENYVITVFDQAWVTQIVETPSL